MNVKISTVCLRHQLLPGSSVFVITMTVPETVQPEPVRHRDKPRC